MKVKSESEVPQLCLTLCNPMDCSPPGSSIHGIFQARVPEWGAIASPLKMLRVNKVVVSDNDKCSVGESNGLNNDDDDVHS